ncbi:hypothetical protein AKO1_003228 [Acrasis kona]|uniref:PITH domain-containing protein n=1 Tax=Acrasis kona TaxID=1008807 RepID=A0AAW2ZKN1_9EUKA
MAQNVDDLKAMLSQISGSAQAEQTENTKADLTVEIDDASAECLNQSKDHTIKHLITNSKSKTTSFSTYVESANDEQLLITLTFKNKVHIRAIAFQAPNEETCPQTIKIFANKTGMDFDDVNDCAPTETFTLDQEQAADKSGKFVNVKITKFRNISSLTIFVQDNYGADTTKLSAIKLIGQTVEGTNMGNLKKQEDGFAE